jgi:hypothetical protein
LFIGTLQFLNALPNHPSGKDFKTQAEFLHRQVSNSITRKLKEAVDPTIYEGFSSILGNSIATLMTGETP